MNNIIRGCSKEFSDNGELINVVFPWEQRFSFKHFRKYTSRTPDIHLNIILLPREHNLWRTVVPCGDITGHLGILNPSKTEITDLEVTVLVDQNVARLQVAMDDASGMDVFQSAL